MPQQYDPIPLPESRFERWIRYGVYVLLVTLIVALLSIFTTDAKGEDAGVEYVSQPALNVSQYPPGPPPQAKVDITASTQPTEEGKSPPPPDVSVSIPMWQNLPIALPQPKISDKGWADPNNAWQIIVTAIICIFILSAAFPRMKSFFDNLGKKKSDPPPPAV